MLTVHYQKTINWGKTDPQITQTRNLCNLWMLRLDYSSVLSALRPKSANSPSEAMPPPASEE